MADNYLESRYEEVFEKGASSPARHASKPSLDTLAHHCGLAQEADGTYRVHPLQIEAVTRTLGYIFPKGCPEVEYHESGEAVLHLRGADAFENGRMAQIISLKACEMGLMCTICDHNTLIINGTVKR